MDIREHRRRARYVEGEINRIGDLLGIPVRSRVTLVNRDGGHPFVVVSPSGGYQHLAFDRGELVTSRRTCDLDELLYWAITDCLRGSAAEWPLTASMLYAISPAWAERWRAELAEHTPGEDLPDLPPAPFEPGSRPVRHPPEHRTHGDWRKPLPLGSAPAHLDRPAPATFGSGRPAEPSPWTAPEPAARHRKWIDRTVG
ncbi:hypothetical protein ACIRBX_01255 [Kitasatospora sp. NPDC096147]|uniref:hypothetical protein n=1 Tax=Kitasatospora sp. NPDC096147 TaxID=3364093 RepID=UPI00381F4316